MANPWDNDPIVGGAPQASPFGNRPVIQEAPPPPKEPTPQNPEQRNNTVTSTQQTQQQIRFNRAKTGSDLGESFRNDPAVKAYREVIPQVAMAEQAKPGGPGDISVLYAWAKAMDPTGSVREGDVQLGQSATGPMQRAQFLISQYRLQRGGQLPPEVRTGLIEEMRNKAGQLNHQYSAVHQHYVQLAQANGVDPATIGEHEGALYRPAEEAYIRAHGGTPRDPAAPQTNQSQGQGDIGFNTPNQSSHAYSSEQAAAYDNFIRTHPNVTPEQLNAFLQSVGMNVGNTEQIANAVNKGGVFDPTQSSAAGVMDPRSQAAANQMMQQNGGMGSAGVAGFGDAASLGSMDELGAAAQALGQSLSGQGSFGENYGINADANRLYLEQLQQQNPASYLGGQVVGGAMLPAGEVSGAADLAKVGAAYGGTYGFNSGSGSLGNRVLGGVEGAAAGGAVGGALGKAGQMLSREQQAVPPLVDPQTGALNQPLEAMSPGQRVVKAEEYGVNLPADAAGGRTAAVIGKGLDIMPGSAGVMEDARRGTESQVGAVADVVASRFGNSRTLNEAGGELQRGANERIERGKVVIGKAYDAIPISDQAPASTSGSVSTLQQLTGRFQSNPDLADALRDPQLERYLGALQKGQISWKDLKDFRTLVGEKIGDMRFGESSRTSDLRALYAGLSEDMRTTAAQMGPGATRAFERANTLNRQNEELIQGALTRILGKDGHLSPEKAAAAVQAMTKGGKSTGDLKTLAQIRAATSKSGAWNEIAATLIRLGGQPVNSQGRDFNPTTFVNWYADMAEPARAMLFGKSELRQALDGFVSVNQRLQKVNALRNTSNTAGSLTAAGTVGTMAGAAMNPLIGAKLLGVMAGNYGMAKLWTNPGFVRLITGYSKAVALGNDNAVRSQIGRIAKLATTNPDLREPLMALQQRLISHANDNMVRGVAASPNGQSDQESQSKR